MTKDSLKLYHFSDEGSFFKELNTIEKLPHTPIRSAIFMYDERYDLFSVLSEFKSDWDIIKNFDKIKEDKEKTLYSCKVRKNKDNEQNIKKIRTFLIIYKSKRIAVLISNQRGDGWSSTLSVFKKFYPFMDRIFLRSFQILEILDYLENETGLNFLVKSYVAKRYFEKPRSEVCYEKIDYKTAFERAIEERLWVDSIWMSLKDDGNSIGNVRLNRKGIFSYSGISFSVFFNSFIKKAISFYIRTYMTILENKSRNLDSLDPKPVRIILKDEVFTENESFKKFVEMINNGLRNWGHSVIGSEGAFGQIMLQDYNSGGSFDIHIVSSKEIYIIPQTQVTTVTFNNLLRIILDNYEGDIENV